MPRSLFKKWSPSAEQISKTRGLGFLGKLIQDPYLFHLNRHSVSTAFFVGLFICFLPILGQIPLAALGALLFRANLPLTMLLVWISNPFTFPIIYYFTYRFGAFLMGRPAIDVTFNLSWQWFNSIFHDIWAPLILGSLLSSLFFGCLSYLLVQWFWRWRTRTQWQERRQKRKGRNNKGAAD